MRELQFGAASFWAARRINKSFRNEHEALEIRGLAWTGVGGCGRDVSAHLRCGHPHTVKVMMRYRVVVSIQAKTELSMVYSHIKMPVSNPTF